MVTGPQQERLQQALTGASAEAVHNGGSVEWGRCASMLGLVARALERASATGQALGGQTGPAISAAFAQTAQGMAGKAHELRRGSEALSLAGNAIIKAGVGQSEMNRDLPQAPHPGPWVPPVDDDVTAKGTYKSDLEAYETSFHAREERARQLADALDADFQTSTATMKSIHGEPDDHGDDGDGDTPGRPKPISVAPPSGGGRPPTGSGHPTVSVVGEPVRDPDHGDHGDHDVPVQPTQDVPDAPTHEVPPPTANPFPDDGTGLPDTGSTGVIGGAPGGVSSPLAGGVGAVAAGGLAGAAIGGIRGGLVPTGSVPGAAARPIGSSARAGSPGALGRGGASGTGSPTSRPTGRGAGVRGGGRGASSAGGGAGGRRSGSGTGAGAGRRGGKKDQDERGHDRDLFDDGDDWIDDAEAAPGVIG